MISNRVLMSAGLALAATSMVAGEHADLKYCGYLSPEAKRDIRDMLQSGEWSLRTSWPLPSQRDLDGRVDIQFVRMVIHIVQFVDGSGGLEDLAPVDQAIVKLNDVMEETGLVFYRDEVRELRSNDFAIFNLESGEDLVSVDNIEGAVDVYIVPEFLSSGGQIAGVTIGGAYSQDEGGIVIGVENTGGPVLAHEVGHYYGLMHPFEWRVNGDECASGDGCQFGGDLICETPADPGTGWWGNFTDEDAYCWRCDTEYEHEFEAEADGPGGQGQGALTDANYYWGDVDCDDRGADCSRPKDQCEDDDLTEPLFLYDPLCNNLMSYYGSGDQTLVSEQLSLVSATSTFVLYDHLVYDTDCNGNDLPDLWEIDSPEYPESDCDGNGRPDSCDMADNPALDCDFSGSLDSCDIEIGLVTDCDLNEIPDTCDLIWNSELDCDGNGLFDTCQVDQGDGTDCDGNGRLDTCDVSDDLSRDCDGNGELDDCQLNAGTDTDCDGDGVLDSCTWAGNPELDCDANGVYDACQIDAGNGTDCDGDGVMDACQMTADESLDCNGDGVLDSCNIANGDEEDCDGNNKPDSCESGLVRVSRPLVDDDGDYQAGLGTSADLHGRVAVSGAPGDDSQAADGGAVSLYRLSDAGKWSRDVELLAANGANGDRLGSAVAMADGMVAAGAPGDDDMGAGSGSVTVFQELYDGWTHQYLLTGSASTPDDAFGSAVAMDDRRLAVGAPFTESGSDDGEVGMVYIFDFDGADWSETATIEHAGGLSGDAFGASLALDGDLLAVGAPGDDQSVLDAGLVRIFRKVGDDWNSEIMLVDQNAEAEGAFGADVDAQGDWVVIGVPGSSVAGPTQSGAVVVYRRVNNVWTLQQTLTVDSPRAGDRLGSQVAISGDLILASAPHDDWGSPLVPNMGAVYVYRYDGAVWAMEGVVGPSVEHRDDALQFGTSLAAHGGQAIAGAPGVDRSEPPLIDDVGAAFMSTLIDCDNDGQIDGCQVADGEADDCDGDGAIDACAISSGIVQDCDGNDVPDACDIAADPGLDINGDGVLDACGCLGDVGDGNGTVGLTDLIAVVAYWGTTNPLADLDGSGQVGVSDLFVILENWGDCG